MIQNMIVFVIFGLAAAYLAFYLYRKVSGRASDCDCGCSGCPDSGSCTAQTEIQDLKDQDGRA